MIQISETLLKFVYSEKATKFSEISTLLLSTVHTDKIKVEISQNLVAFSEYINFPEFVESFQMTHSQNSMTKAEVCVGHKGRRPTDSNPYNKQNSAKFNFC